MTKRNIKYRQISNNVYKIRDNMDLPPWCSGTLNSTNNMKIDKTARFLNDLNISRIGKYDRKKKVERIITKQNIIKTKKRCSSLLLFSFLILITVSITICSWLEIIETPSLQIFSNKLEHSLPVPEECKARLMQLTAALSRTEHALKRNRRYNEFWNAAYKRDLGIVDEENYVSLGEDAIITVGSGTKEWTGGRATLWGLIPLWKTSPSPYTIVASRKPTLGDCWPFMGSQGEVVIELTRSAQLHNLNIEHVRPDSANSAPKKFSLHAVFENGTLIEIINGQYTKHGTAQQLYRINMETPVKRIIFKILSNHGNGKYTCIYRLHLYGNFDVNV